MRKNMKNAVKTVTITNEALAQSIVDGAVSICGIKVASIPVDLLEVDETYQRDTHDVQELIPFDKKKCGFILVSFRNGNRLDVFELWICLYRNQRAGGMPGLQP